MPGAAVLCATAALRAGAGKLQIGTCASVAPFVGCARARVAGRRRSTRRARARSRAAAPRRSSSARTRRDALVIGPGLVDAHAATALIGPSRGSSRCPSSSTPPRSACFADRADTVRASRRPRDPHAARGRDGDDAALRARGGRGRARALRARGGAHVRRGGRAQRRDDVRRRSRRRAVPQRARRRRTRRRRVPATCSRGSQADCSRAASSRCAPPSWAVALHARAGDVLAERIGTRLSRAGAAGGDSAADARARRRCAS